MKFVTIDNGYYDDFLGTCLTAERVAGMPVKAFNEVLERESGLVCFVHSDVTCKGLEESILDTIGKYGFDGAMGVVGAGSKWGSLDHSFMSPTCDSCCLVVDASRPERFDERFDGYHLYVEDYCVQVGGARIMLINANEGWGVKHLVGDRWFLHHSQTLRRKGHSWGDYNDYKLKLYQKWGRVIPTT